MEKILNLIKEDEKYKILIDNDSIEIVDLKIDSQMVFDKIYSLLPIDDNYIKITLKTSLTNKEDKIIFDQISSMFKKIDCAINKQIKVSKE